jgi:hypothetical protein
VVVGVYVWTHVDLGSLCGPSFYVEPVSKWTQFDDDDVSMIVTKTVTVTMTVYVDPVSKWTQFDDDDVLVTVTMTS